MGVKVSTYDQHRRPHHLRDTLPEFSSGARFTQTPRKFPGLRMHRSGHRYASLGINYRPIHAFYQVYRKLIIGLSAPSTAASAHHEFEVGSCCGVAAGTTLLFLDSVFVLENQHMPHRSGTLPSLIGYCWHNKVSPWVAFHWPSIARQEMYNLFSPLRTPPLTGLKSCPLAVCVCKLVGLDFGLRAVTVWMTGSMLPHYHKNHNRGEQASGVSSQHSSFVTPETGL